MSLRHWLLLGGTVVLAAMGVVHSSAQGGAPRPAADPEAAPVRGARPSVSGDGTTVAFEGAPVSPDDPRTTTVYVRDLSTGATTEVTPTADGVRPGDTVQPVLSADGCRLFVVTQMALDLFRDDDTGDRWDVYATTLPTCGGRTGAWELVSTRAGSSVGAAASDDVDPSFPPAVSGEGALVAYTHRADRSDLDPAAGFGGVNVVDLTVPLGAPDRVRPFPVGAGTGSTGVVAPSTSADGTVVAAASVDGGVLVWDRAVADPARAVTELPAADAGEPRVSADGAAVAFTSADPEVLPDGATPPVCASTCPSQVFVWHRADGSLHLVSAVTTPDGTVLAGDGPSSQPVPDRTGASVVFVSRATNLLPRRSPVIGGPDDGDVLQAVVASGEVRRVSLGVDGVTPLPATNAHPAISGDGRVVVFDRLGGRTGVVRDLMVVRRDARVAATGIDLGTVSVGFPGPEWYVAVHNVGLTSFTASSVESDSDEFLVTGGSCTEEPVAPGDTCTVYVVFVPDRAGLRSGVVTVTDGAGVELQVPVTGRGGDPELEPLPAGADAAATLVGDISDPVQFTITNIAFHRSTVVSVVLTGANPDDFAVSDDQCTGRRLDALDVCTVDVVFSPTAAGRRAATVVATTDRGADSTMLIGGVGRYAATLSVGSPAAPAPGIVAAHGAGFAAGAEVLVGWSDGVGNTMRVVADADGSFTAQLVVRPNERSGRRTLVALALDGTSARTEVLVVSRRPSAGPASPRWPG